MLSVPSNPNVWQVIHPGGRSGQLSLAFKTAQGTREPRRGSWVNLGGVIRSYHRNLVNVTRVLGHQKR